MKNNLISCLILAAALLFSNNTSALVIYPTVTLPHTFNASSPGGYIDVNNDGTPDFQVRITPGEFAIMRGASPILSPSSPGLMDVVLRNMLIVEDYGDPRTPASEQPLETTTPEGTFVSILNRGELIGPSLSGPQFWFPSTAVIFGEPLTASSPALSSSWATGVNSGYIGIQFYIGSQLYYGWLNLEIDPNMMWFKINSAGYPSTPSTPVPAGLNDPYAVPVPIIASLLGLGLIGGGVVVRKRRKATK